MPAQRLGLETQDGQQSGGLLGPETSKRSMRTRTFPFVCCHPSVPRVVLGCSNVSVNLCW